MRGCRRRITDEQIAQVRALLRPGVSHRRVAREIGLSRQTVDEIAALKKLERGSDVDPRCYQLAGPRTWCGGCRAHVHPRDGRCVVCRADLTAVMGEARWPEAYREQVKNVGDREPDREARVEAWRQHFEREMSHAC